MAGLDRLEGLIGTIMRAGVALSAVMMLAGLSMIVLGLPQAGTVLSWGLIVLMMIPSSRILVSLVDAAFRRDWLLVGATIVVCAIIVEEVFKKIFAS